MALNYVVTKRVLGFDETKSVCYVPRAVTSGIVDTDKLCKLVSTLCGIHRKVVDLVLSGATDIMAQQIEDGKCVRLGEFGLFRPTITGKSATSEEEVTSSSIVRRRIVFTPGKIFQGTLEDMAVTRATVADIDWTDGSSTSSGSTSDSGTSSGGSTDSSEEEEVNPFG